MAAEDRRVWLVIGGLVILFMLFVPLSAVAFGITYDYTLTTVAIGGAVLGTVSGVLGAFAVLRRESLLGDALSHAALPGVTIGFLLAGRDLGWLLLGAGVASWLSVIFITWVIRTTRIKQDTAMGMTLAAFFALGIVILSYIQSRADARQAGLDKFILGQAAAMVRQEVYLISGVGLAAFAGLGLFWKEFKLLAFDREFAGANGFPVRFLEALLSTLIVVAIVLGLQIAGVILMVGMLIAPAIAARQWTHHLGQMVILSGVFGAFAGAGGAILSGADADLPTGPLIIVVASALVFASICLAPGRGLVWAGWRQRHDRQRFASQNVLRDIYHHARQHQTLRYPALEGMLIALRGHTARLGLRNLRRSGLIERDGKGGWMLTPAGVAYAQQDAHNQRLWELYREYHEELQLPPILENRQQAIADVLPQEAVVRLERLLQGGGG
jgi:manganese/zinc/iron transport system permease protein